MNKIKDYRFFKIIAGVLIFTFLALDAAWAYPPEHDINSAKNSNLASPDAFDRFPAAIQVLAGTFGPI